MPKILLVASVLALSPSMLLQGNERAIREGWNKRAARLDFRSASIEANVTNEKSQYSIRRFVHPENGLLVELSDNLSFETPSSSNSFKIKRHVINSKAGYAFSVSRPQGESAFVLEAGSKSSTDSRPDGTQIQANQLGRNYVLDHAPFGASHNQLGSSQGVIWKSELNEEGQTQVKLEFLEPNGDFGFGQGDTVTLICDPHHDSRIVRAVWTFAARTYTGGSESYDCHYDDQDNLVKVLYDYHGMQPLDTFSFRKLDPQLISDKEFTLAFYGIDESDLIKQRRIWPIILLLLVTCVIAALFRRIYSRS